MQVCSYNMAHFILEQKMNEQKKQRMSLRGKCLASIVQKIDTWIDEDGYLEMNAIKQLVHTELENYTGNFSNKDLGHIHKYIESYMEMLISYRNVRVNGYTPMKHKRDYLNPNKNPNP